MNTINISTPHTDVSNWLHPRAKHHFIIRDVLISSSEIRWSRSKAGLHIDERTHACIAAPRMYFTDFSLAESENEKEMSCYELGISYTIVKNLYHINKHICALSRRDEWYLHHITFDAFFLQLFGKQILVANVLLKRWNGEIDISKGSTGIWTMRYNKNEMRSLKNSLPARAQKVRRSVVTSLVISSRVFIICILISELNFESFNSLHLLPLVRFEKTPN